MTTSIQKDALLSQFATLAYKEEAYLNNPTNLPSGWQLVDFEVNGPFAAFAFKNETTGEVIVAYRGTDGLSDLAADTGILTGKWDPQFQQGMDFLGRVRSNTDLFPRGYDPSKLLVTGHSLGGAIAQVVAQAYGLDGSTIDPGAAARVVATPEFQAAAMAAGLPAEGLGAASSFTNHLVVGSVVSGGTGPHVGQVSYVPSLNFSSEQAITAFLIGLVNPVAGFAYAIGTDQFSNKHSSEQISQAIQLMAGAGDAGSVGSEPFVLTPKVERWEIDPVSGESKPVYSQTEFEVRTKAGELQSTVKFTGSGTDRQFEVFDASGDLKSTTTLSPSGAITVQPVRGDTITIAYLPESHTNLDGTVTLIYRTPDGSVVSTSTTTVYEDGSTSETIRYADGRIVKLTYDGEGNLLRQEAVESGGQTLLRTISAAAPTLIDALSLVKAIQSGEPLPILASRLRLANDLSTVSGAQNLNLTGAANAASGILSLMSLDAALERGDTLGAITAGAQVVSFGATAYANFLGYSGGKALQNAIAAGEFGAAGQALGAISDALPYLSLINAIAQGDEVGAAVAVVSYFVPVVGWAYSVYSIVSSLFEDDEPPEAWGAVAGRVVGLRRGDERCGRTRRTGDRARGDGPVHRRARAARRARAGAQPGGGRGRDRQPAALPHL
ncbi:MAG: hypothetical protein ACOZCP_09645, partial [Pseudomonadota bacterium]